MEKGRGNRRASRKTSKNLCPTQTLVGFSGKVLHRKLRPLRRTCSDKKRELALEQEYGEKCNRLACQLKNHMNLLEVILELASNKGDLRNIALSQDLQGRHLSSMALIKFLLEEVGMALDVLPKQIKDLLHELLRKDEKLRVKLRPVICFGEESLKGRSNVKSNPVVSVARSTETQSKKELYQVFVHGARADSPLVLTLRPNDKGYIIAEKIRKKCPNLPSAFILLHQGRKISDELTLGDQGLIQECNIHVHFALCGGMDKPKDGASARNNKGTSNKGPPKWKKAQVANWIDEVCKEFEIDERDVSKLKTISGAGLMYLTRQDWIERSPNQGDLFFNLWTNMIKKYQEVSKETTKSPPDSPRKGAGQAPIDDGPSLVSRRDSPSSLPLDGKQLAASANAHSVNERTPQGPFGVVENLDDIGVHQTIDDLAKKAPSDGDVVTVKGLCSSRPRDAGGAGTVLLRNDPRSASGDPFLEVKVDVRACINSKILTKHKISSILTLKLGEPLVVRGKIERLDKGLQSMKKGFQILPFKIVVNSDEHAAARKEEKVQRTYLRQLSTPWPITCGIFPAEGSTHEPLFRGDALEKTNGILYCLPDEASEKIKEFVVALKNSMTGDIYVGVNNDGRVVGLKAARDKIIQEREEMVKTVGGVLPGVNDSVTFCVTASEAHECVEKRKTFVAAMWLPSAKMCLEDVEETDEVSIMFRIHVVKGASQLYFVKQEHTHAYTRVGAETKLLTDHEGLFNRLESLASRKIPEKSPTQIKQEVDKASTYELSETKYSLFDRVRFETDQREFKVIVGDPMKIILKDYIAKYSASFLNSDGGHIFFGIDEDSKAKIGRAVGVSISVDDRKKLVHESSKIICNFWPPVDSSQFVMDFIDVTCQASKHFLKFPKTCVEREGKIVSVVVSDNSKVLKLTNFARSKISGQVAMLRLANNRFCLLVKDATKTNVEEFISEIDDESKKAKYFSVDAVSMEEVKTAVKDLCVVRLHVRASPYPIHLTSPFKTFCLDQQGVVTEMKPTQLLERFSRRDYRYDPDKFLTAVNGFEKQNTSYVLICSPFCLPKQQRDLYGIVVPEWAMVLDFDQTPNQEGHLLNIVRPLHDRHQVERNLLVKTPLDRRLALNPSNGVCWCAVRGYEEIDNTLSKEDHASWMRSHGLKIRALIEQLIAQINPNQLVVVCLWGEGNEKLLPSVDNLLQQTFSLWGPTKVVFVCSSPSAESAVLKELVEPLSRAGYGVKRDNIFVALPHEMARHVGAKLPPPYRSEDAFQIPRKFFHQGGDKIIPDTLPQTVRQAIKGHLQIMYLNIGTASHSKPINVDKVRVEFYSGSEVDDIGLANGIAIEREKMKELKKALKSFLNDRRSHVCLTVLKAERGAGATTLCLQLLYEYHKQYVCARLLEFHDSLVVNIEKINQHSRLPFILFVDSEMANLPEFNDFKNEAERKKLDLKLVVIESDLYTQHTAAPKKKQSIPYFVGTAPFKTVELGRELTQEEVSQLVDQLLKLKQMSEDKKAKLKELAGRASKSGALRKFAFFSLTVFGRKFTGLKTYVELRLAQATDQQLQILEFLALTHVYTDFLFPVNVLSRLLKTDTVLLERVFSNDNVRELLSPPSSVERNVRRMSFVEVAEELLKQVAKQRHLTYTLYLKDVALRLAKEALATPCPSKRIDRITRRLYVTSEYGSEKFSPLVRYMRDNDPDVARDMLHELSGVFEKGTSVWAHLLAHLAKYYMSEYKDFEHAIPLIQEAASEHNEDVLLHHIYGDVIRLHMQNCKDQKEFSMDEVIRFAIRSSSCFEIVREKRPLMEHGYSSDALVRKVVMLAAIKSVSGTSYIDFLKTFLEERKTTMTQTALSQEEKFIIALVPESFAFLRAVPINEYTAKLKDDLLRNLGDLDELKAFSGGLKEATKGTSDEEWVDAAVLQTMSLVYGLEVERRQLGPDEADERIQKLEELLTKTNLDEESMKIWIRCVRLGSKLPNLKAVRDKVDRWLKVTRRRSPFALFYNYVVATLEALSDPSDTEKMKRVTDSITELQRKRSPRSKGVSQDPSLPVEWLHPKEGRHINSLDSLLYHEDLVRERLKGKSLQRQERAGKEIIEKALFQEQITKWMGVVSEISTEWKGVICFKKFINVPFVPVNVQPCMPNPGDEVQFCLAFHWTGPCAWYVVCEPAMAKAHKASASSPFNISKYADENDAASDTSEEGDEKEKGLAPLVGKSLHMQTIKSHPPRVQEGSANLWTLDDKMQGIIYRSYPSKGYGYIHHPSIEGSLYFHAKQIDPPVDSLSAVEAFSIVSFTVGETSRGLRAMNIKTVEEKNIDPQLRDCREKLRKADHEEMKASAAAPQRVVEVPKTLQDFFQMGSRQEGHICDLKSPPISKIVHGYIEVPSTCERLFFQESLSGIPKRETGNIYKEAKVQFSVGRNDKGFYAKDLIIQRPESKQKSCKCGWEDSVGKTIQEGYVAVLKRDLCYGFITRKPPKESCRNPTGLYFNDSHVRTFPFNQLNVGDRVHFLVGENERGCVAQQIDVQRSSIQHGQYQGNFQPASHMGHPYFLDVSSGPLMRIGDGNTIYFDRDGRRYLPPPGSPLDASWNQVTRRKR